MSTATNPKIMDYLSTVKDQISLQELKGYLPANAIINAYTTGEKDGQEKFIDELVNKVTNNVIQHYLYTSNIATTIQSYKYKVYGVYLCPKEGKSIITTDTENVVDDDFIKLFYEQAFKFENQFRDETFSDMHISFIPVEHLDEEELELDNYIKMKGFGEEAESRRA